MRPSFFRSMIPGPESLARWSARRRWTVVGIWLALLILGVLLNATLLGDALTTEGEATGTTESERVEELLGERFSVEQVAELRVEEVLLVRSDAGRAVEDPAFREFVVGLTDQLRGLGARVVVGSASFYDEGEEALISADRRTAVLRFTLADVFQIGEFFGNVRFFLDENPGFGVLAVEQPTAGRVQEIVIVRSESGTVDDAAFQTLVEDLFFELIALGSDVVQRGTHYYLAGDEGLVSADRSTTLLPLNVNEDEVEQVLDVVQRFRGAEGFELLITGPAIVDLEFEETAESDLVTGELQFGLPIAVVVLLLVFGAVVAAALPLVLALTAIMIALGVAALLGQAFDLSIFITNMVFMIGLAVGIDYSLFIVARYREERGAGRAQAEAIARAGGTAGRAVLFSGIAVVLALIGMVLVPETTFISLGTGAIVVVLVSVAASLTLLPAVLSLLGDRVNGLQVPLVSRLQGDPHPERAGGMWDRVAQTVMKAPGVSLLVAGGLLVALTVPAFSLNMGSNGVGSLPDGFESKDGFQVLQRDFAAGLAEPTLIAVDGPLREPAVEGAIEQLTGAIEADGAFGPVERADNAVGDLAVLSVAIRGGAVLSEFAQDAVRRVRDDYIPEAFAGVPAQALVGGETASNLEFVEIASDALLVVFPFVLGLSFLLLLVMFRSIVVPIKAIVMNLLSVGAAYGLLVLVFQEGILNEVFGFQQADVVEAWIPVFLFSVLFGLSMDYHVFLLSRIKERWDETGDNHESVAFGLRSTGRLITGAALIMVAVFAGFASGELVMFQQVGFGLGVAILLDATVIRSVLVPASMKLLGAWNWYLPTWLEWLPAIQLEPLPGEAPVGEVERSSG